MRGKERVGERGRVERRKRYSLYGVNISAAAGIPPTTGGGRAGFGAGGSGGGMSLE